MLATADRRGSFDPATARRVRGDRALVRQIGEIAAGAGSMTHHDQCSWESITFAGTRHRMKWAFEGDDVAGGEQLLAQLAEHEFVIPGHLVAGAAVKSVDHRMFPPLLVVELEILVLDD